MSSRQIFEVTCPNNIHIKYTLRRSTKLYTDGGWMSQEMFQRMITPNVLLSVMDLKKM